MDTHCKNPDCGQEIETMAFKGEDWCSVKCRKALGGDLPNHGNMVLLSPEEERAVKDFRAQSA